MTDNGGETGARSTADRARENTRNDGETGVLVADDEATVRRLAERMLRRLGFIPVLCATGEEAVSFLRENPAEVQVAIVDMVMPGMQGSECADRLRNLCPSLKVVLATGQKPDSDSEAVEKADAVLQKPYSVQSLEAILSDLVD